jgi:hypothetical protein
MNNRDGIKKTLKITFFIATVAIIIGYSYFAFIDYISGPEIIILTPENGSTIASSTVSIQGQALRIQDITMNNRPILVDEQGNFKESVLLFRGYNVVLIYAKDKFGRTTEYKMELVYQD